MTGRKKNLNPTKQEELEIFENCWLQRREQAITAYFQKRAKRRPIQSQVGKKKKTTLLLSINLLSTEPGTTLGLGDTELDLILLLREFTVLLRETEK